MHKHLPRSGALHPALLMLGLILAQVPLTAGAAGPTHILVQIVELTGTGPNGRSHQLFQSADGYTTTLNALGRVGSQVSAGNLPEGAYHTLYVRLRDDYEKISADGRRQQGSFSAQGKPTTVRIRGMIMVSGGKATPHRMLEPPGHRAYGNRGGEYDEDDD